jgi:hypothetical protein
LFTAIVEQVIFNPKERRHEDTKNFFFIAFVIS